VNVASFNSLRDFCHQPGTRPQRIGLKTRLPPTERTMSTMVVGQTDIVSGPHIGRRLCSGQLIEVVGFFPRVMLGEPSAHGDNLGREWRCVEVSANTLPKRLWAIGSAEYPGSPICENFNSARNSSRSASFSIVMGIAFRRDNNLDGYSFKLTSSCRAFDLTRLLFSFFSNGRRNDKRGLERASFAFFFHHEGTSPQRIGTSSRTVQPSNIKPVAAGGRFVY
jgi:hypothetical protein